MKKQNKDIVDSLEVEELVQFLTKTKSDERDALENALYEKYEMPFDKFHELIQDLMDALHLGISPLTETPFVGFSKQEGKAAVWLMKKDITSEFIAGVIEWLGGPDIKKGGKGMERLITSEGKPEYKIYIVKPEYEVKIVLKADTIKTDKKQ